MNNILSLFLKSLTVKNLAWVTSANIVIAFFGLIFTIVTARNVSPAEYGIFVTIISFVMICADLGELGIGGGLSNFLPSLYKNNHVTEIKQIIKTTLFLQLSVATILSIIIFSSTQYLANLLFHDSGYKYLLLIRLAGIGIVIMMLFNYVYNLITAKEEFTKIFILSAVSTIPRTVFLVVLVLMVNINALSIFATFMSGPLLALVVGLFFVPLHLFTGDKFYPLGKIMRFSLYLAANKLFVALFSRLDLLMLSALSNTTQAGLYSASSRIAFIYPLIGGSIGTVLAPKYAQLDRKKAVEFTRKIYAVMGFFIISVFILMLSSNILINLIYGSAYQASVPVLNTILVSTIPFLLNIPLNNLITFTLKKPKILAISSLVQLVAIIITNSILIPKLGAQGPAISIVISSSIALLISAFYSLRFLK